MRKEKIGSVILTISVVAVLCLVANYAMVKGEVAECRKWDVYAGTYPAFYLSQWQAEQCTYYGIIINALVK